MTMKKVVSLIMIIALMLTMAAIPTSFSAQTTDVAATAADGYNLASNIQDGNILHAFNWRMTDLVKYAPEIAAAGYATVQISPIQQTKVTDNDGAFATDWWSFYQPTDMKIGNALGTAADLKAATSELHKYGIKVIADVVTNHVQNCQNKAEANLVASYLNSTSTAARHSLTSHPGGAANDSSRKNQTQLDMDGQLPDMNTGLKSYQNYVIENLLTPLANNGVDGFRFDAAKHIETPDDGSVASDYWPTITNAIKSKNANAFIYGEILANAGQFNISSYTKYMSVTDYAYGGTVRSALSSKNASSLSNYGYSGSQKSQNVLWVESHDNFCSQASTSLTKKQQILGWAVVGSRKDAPALFFVRPAHEALDSPGFIKYDELMGAPGAADTWKDPAVVAVNQFKNAFVGQSETDYASGANFFVQRGTSGMVIVNLNGSATSISQSCSMANGTYKDQVSGNTFTVSGGKISGNVGSTGVAVVYNNNSVPKMTVKLNNVALTTEANHAYSANTATVAVTLDNATSGSIQVSNQAAKTVSAGTTTFTVNSTAPSGKAFNITVSATNGANTITNTYTIVKDTTTASRRVYFDNSATKWSNVYVFSKKSLNENGSFPGTKMTLQGNNIYYADVPANTKYVKFNEGPVSAHIGHSASECAGYCGRTLPPTVIDYGSSTKMANLIKGGYELVGTMICRNLRMESYNYSIANLGAADTTLGGSDTPTTPTPTQPTPTQPVNPGEKYLRGDADGDGDVAIFDATHIQRILADMDPKTEAAVRAGDVDGSGELEVFDVSYIQRYLAQMSDPYQIGQWFDASGTVIPTEAPVPTEDPDPDPDPTTPAISLKPLTEKYVAVIYCEASGTDDTSRNSEHAFNEATATLTYDFPGASYVFVRRWNGGVQYCTDGWSNFANPVTLVNQKNLTGQFDKMYVPEGTHTLYMIVNDADDTITLGYDGAVGPTPGPTPTSNPDPDPSGNDVYFEPGQASVDNPAWFAWVWNDGSEGQWIAGVEDIYGNVTYPGAAAYGNMLVARMPSGSTSGDWSACWNQSEDIKVQAGKTLYFTEWGSGNKFKIGWK